MRDQFATPLSNDAALLKKRTLPQNTAFMHTVLFHNINVKQNGLEKHNFKEIEQQMYECLEL